MAPERLFELRRTTFDTPQFRGITFIESEAKTIINHVPGNYLPFNWTINPYRGCSHACSFCMAGETPILMADGRTKPLGDLQIGDTIYGTRREGSYRRYVPTTVLNHWSTVKAAYRIELADGTELIASGDHRFLSDRGWKFVTGTEQGSNRRPHLTTDSKLITTGAFSPSRSDLPSSAYLDGLVRVESIEPLDKRPLFDITTGTGDFIANGVISHNCFARSTHTYMDMDAGRDFETKIVVKVNAPEVLRGQLRSKRWKGEHIAMGTATDPYQRAEGRYKLMRGILQALIDYRNPFSILTKGTLMLRDIDLLLEAAEVTDVSTAYSVGTLDEDAWRKSEPGTPHPRKRLEAVKRLNEAGIPCGVMVAAVLPGITDGIDQLKEVVHAAVDAGATHVSPILLHLRPKVKEVYMEWLADNYPHLVDQYEAMYGRSAYAPKAKRDELSRRVSEILESVPRAPARVWQSKSNRRAKTTKARLPETGDQLSLI